MQIAPPYRVQRTYTQRLHAAPAEVFPLLCPVREVDWVEGWLPGAVFSASGVAERDCVFTTPDGDREAVWFVTRHEPEALFVEFVKITPGRTAGRIWIQLRACDDGTTEADVTYQFTALSEAGHTVVDAFTEAHYTAFMQQWESALNHYVRTGRMKGSVDETG